MVPAVEFTTVAICWPPAPDTIWTTVFPCLIGEILLIEGMVAEPGDFGEAIDIDFPPVLEAVEGTMIHVCPCDVRTVFPPLLCISLTWP